MGLEPTTATLATWRSTTELHPRGREKHSLCTSNYKADLPDCKRENEVKILAMCHIYPTLKHSAANTSGMVAGGLCSRASD